MVLNTEQPPPLIGQYMHPVINQHTEKSSPWERNYNQPPPLKNLVSRSYPIHDIRPLISPAGTSTPDSLLQTHGFAVVKHKSSLVTQLSENADLPSDAVSRIYHSEMRELIRQTTGAKQVFISVTVLRRGKRAPETYQLPTGYGSFKQDTTTAMTQPAFTQHKLANQPNINLAAPVRVPHMDTTPLGARQMIRCQDADIRDAAVASGIIGAEDAICKRHGVSATDEESSSIIAEKYNRKGKLGPRYAAYSIWRPLKTVGRDPLTMCPRWGGEEGGLGLGRKGERVYWPYLNRIKGAEGLGGDYLREYAMLGVGREERVDDGEDGDGNGPKWWYVSEQKSDEVLFIKLFDSAALGAESEHASAPWHASPEIGSTHGEEPRESIELRVLAIW